MKKYIFIIDLDMGNEQYKIQDYFIILLQSLQQCNFKDNLVVITNKEYSSEYVFPNNTFFVDVPYRINYTNLKREKFASIHFASEKLNLTDNDIIFICDARDVYFQDFDFIDKMELKHTWFSFENELLRESNHMKSNIIKQEKYNNSKVWEKLEQINEKYINAGICLTNKKHLKIMGNLVRVEWWEHDLAKFNCCEQPVLNKIYFSNRSMDFIRILKAFNSRFVSINSHGGIWKCIDNKIYNFIEDKKIYSSVIHQWDRREDLKEIILNLNEKRLE